MEWRRGSEEDEEFSTLQRGWFVGAEQFRKELLAQMKATATSSAIFHLCGRILDHSLPTGKRRSKLLTHSAHLRYRCWMPRKLRVQYPGAIYHLMNRGDRREKIFHDDEDQHRFLITLAEGLRQDRVAHPK
jgi:hypothetical protein